MAVIKVENLSKKYLLGSIGSTGIKSLIKKNVREEFWALKDINFEINKGEIVGVIGKNGAGKSTLLKVLSKITHPTTGRIEIDGKISSLLEVGTGFHPELTGRENVFMNGTILGMTKHEIHSKFDEIVAFSGIEKFIDTPVKRYSSGMYVRLAFAVAAHLEPEIMIVDEVLAVGDLEFQKKCLGKMNDVAGNGKTVLFVSHNMGSVKQLCPKSILLKKGELIDFNKTSDIINQYLTGSNVEELYEVNLSEEGAYDRKIKASSLISFHSIKIKGESNKLKMFCPLDFELEINSKVENQNFEIGLNIKDTSGNVIVQCVSNWENFDVKSKVGLNKIILNIPEVRMYPGKYVVDVWIKRIGERVTQDFVQNLLYLFVEESNIVYKNAYFQKYSKNSQVYIENNWIIND